MDASAYEQFRDLEDRHWWFLGRKAIFGHLLRHEQKTRGQVERALDLGCGMGGMMDDLAGVSREVFGTDIEQGALSYCQARGFPAVFRADGLALPFADQSLDLITAFDTIEHIEDDLGTLKECLRVLKPGGRMMISVPAWQFLYANQDRIVHHHRRYTKGRLLKTLKAAGFRPRKVSYFNAWLFPLILPAVLLIKLKEWLRPPPPGEGTTNVSGTPAKPINHLLTAIFSSERRLLTKLSFPLGHSLLAIADKPE